MTALPKKKPNGHLEGCLHGTYNPSTHDPFQGCACASIRARHEAGARQADAIKALELEVASSGTANQLERYRAGYLPADELTALARQALFAPFERCSQEGVRRAHIRDLKSRDVSHVHGCPRLDIMIAYDTVPADKLSDVEWDRLTSIKKAAEIAREHHWIIRSGGAGVVVDPLRHVALCTNCRAQAHRTTARVTIHWAGRELVREYDLSARH